MPEGLSPHLQEIYDRAMVNYAEGGIGAVRRMVDDLAPEVDAAAAFADSAEGVQKEAVRLQSDLDDAQVREAVAMDDATSGEAITAMSVHSFARRLVEIFEEVEASPKDT
ncbi:MAG: hypothetical protein WD846_04090 [Patescibacteria group bacterium]